MGAAQPPGRLQAGKHLQEPWGEVAQREPGSSRAPGSVHLRGVRETQGSGGSKATVTTALL